MSDKVALKNDLDTQIAAVNASIASGLAERAAALALLQIDVDADEVRLTGAEADIDALQAAAAGAFIGYATLALLNADLAHPAGTLAYVTNDPLPANNGYYLKSGASGAGAWTHQSYTEESILIAKEDAQDGGASKGGGIEKFTSTAGLTPANLAGGAAPVIGLNADGMEITGDNASSTGLYVVDTRFDHDAGLLDIELTVKHNIHTAGTPGAMLGVGEGAARRFIILRETGQFFGGKGDNTTFNFLASPTNTLAADPDLAFAVNDTIKIRLRVDNDNQTILAIATGPTGLVKSYYWPMTEAAPTGRVWVGVYGRAKMTMKTLLSQGTPPIVTDLAKLNILPDQSWTGAKDTAAGPWSLTTESGYKILRVDRIAGDASTRRYAYDLPAVDRLAPGEWIAAQVEGWQDHASTAQLILAFLDAAGVETTVNTRLTSNMGATPLNAWRTLRAIAKIPAGTVFVRMGFDITGVSGGAAAIAKFRRPRLMKDTESTNVVTPYLTTLPPILNLIPDQTWSQGLKNIVGNWSVVTEAGLYVLKANRPTPSATTYRQAYDFAAAGPLAVGQTVTAFVEGRQDAVLGNMAIIFLDAAGVEITVPATRITKSLVALNTWTPLVATFIVPANTATIRVSYNLTGADTGAAVEVKFRNPYFIIGAGQNQVLSPLFSATPLRVVFVSPTGNDADLGTSSSTPFLTIGRAIDAINGERGIVELADGDYRLAGAGTTLVDLAKIKGHVEFRSAMNGRARIFGGDRLVVTKTGGFAQVYQAPLAAKPTGMGGGRGEPMIFEWGTPSKIILAAERHPLHRGQTYRLPYTEMLEAPDQATLDTVGGRGKWWWNAGTIYFAATDGSDATLKRYESRVRYAIRHTGGDAAAGASAVFRRVDVYFSLGSGFDSHGLQFWEDQECRSFGNYDSGFAHDANFVKSYRPEGAGNGNDGINAHPIATYAATDNMAAICEGVYFDPWMHDNYDDGMSHHERGGATLIGGLLEYCTGDGLVPIAGAAVTAYHAHARRCTTGFWGATVPLDTRQGSVHFFHECISEDNVYNFKSSEATTIVRLIRCISRNPTTWGFFATNGGELDIVNCLYTGDALKQRSGGTIITDAAAA